MPALQKGDFGRLDLSLEALRHGLLYARDVHYRWVISRYDRLPEVMQPKWRQTSANPTGSDVSLR